LMIGNCLAGLVYGNALLCLGYSLSPDSVVKHLAKCRTLDDLPVKCCPPVRNNQKKQTTKIDAASVSGFCCSSQTALWQTYPDVHVITLNQVPPVYPTLGIDRALALWGAGETWGWPMLVIDAGTALTLTGADADHCLVSNSTRSWLTAPVSGSTNRRLTACRHRGFGVSTSALGFEYN